VLFALAPAALAALTLIQQIDSTVPVERGQRLEVDLFAGDVDVKTWSRNAVRVVADPDGRGRVEIERSATSVSVRTTGRRGPPLSTDIELTVPAWMALDISGVYTDISIAGARGPISAETVQGDVSAEGGDGLVSVKSVQGGVSVTGATTLTATSVNGDLNYDGPLHSGGRYALSTHNGDITLAVAEAASAAVSVSTFNGEFESDFPVTLTETRKGKRFNFTIGSGSAQVTLESFQGTISLVRPGSQRHRDDDN